MLLVVLEALAPFGHRGNMSSGNPPEAIVRLLHLLKPFGTVSQGAHVIGVVDVIVERFKGVPNRHIHVHKGISVISDIGGIA
jgi:hypothetical protein